MGAQLAGAAAAAEGALSEVGATGVGGFAQMVGAIGVGIVQLAGIDCWACPWCTAGGQASRKGQAGTR